MADREKSAKAAPGGEQKPRRGGARSLLNGQDGLARLIIQLSFGVLTIGFVAVALMAATPQAEAVKDAFNILIPVLSTWVGAVVTFYFSDKSQERLNQTLTDVIDHRAVMAQTPISKKMVARDSIRGLIDESGDKLQDMKIVELLSKLDSAGASRLVMLSGKKFSYVLHKATLQAFITSQTLAEVSNNSAIQPEKLTSLTLRNFLDDQGNKAMATDQVVFVPIDSTLSDARDALRKVTGAEDIFITLTGNRAEDVLGWMTDVDLLSLLRSE